MTNNNYLRNYIIVYIVWVDDEHWTRWGKTTDSASGAPPLSLYLYRTVLLLVAPGWRVTSDWCCLHPPLHTSFPEDTSSSPSRINLSAPQRSRSSSGPHLRINWKLSISWRFMGIKSLTRSPDRWPSILESISEQIEFEYAAASPSPPPQQRTVTAETEAINFNSCLTFALIVYHKPSRWLGVCDFMESIPRERLPRPSQ